jgi:hypothetical protein
MSGLTHSQTPIKHPSAGSKRPPRAIALAALALALAIAAFVLTLTDNDGGTTIVREVSVVPAAEAPAHFKERPDESVVAAAVGAAFDDPSESPFSGLEDKANSVGQEPTRPDGGPDESKTAAAVGGGGPLSELSEQAQMLHERSQYRVNPSTGSAAPQPDSANDDAYVAGH